MRLSWGQGAVAALVLVVAGGMLELPSRVLGPARAVQSPINLPRSTSTPAVVLANPPAEKQVFVHVTAPPAPRPAPVVQPVTIRIPAEQVTARPEPRRARPSPAISTPPLVVALGRAKHLPLPPDPARPPAASPTPAPSPPPTVPTTAPAVPPTTTAAPPPATTTTESPPTTPTQPSCDGDSRPGWGNGDDNHCHTGPPGQDKDKGSGHHK